MKSTATVRQPLLCYGIKHSEMTGCSIVYGYTCRYISDSLQGERAAEHGGDERHRAEHGDLACREIHLTSIQGLHRPVGLHHRLATGKLKLRERSELQRQQAESQDAAFMTELSNVSSTQPSS